MGIQEKGTINPYKFYVLRKKHSIEEIAKMCGYSKSGLYHWCWRNGVDTRRVTDSDIEDEIKTKTVKEIAYEYGVNLQTVYERLKKLHISPKLQRGIK